MFAARSLLSRSGALRPSMMAAVAGRRAPAQAQTQIVQRRNMGGHGAAAPATGWEGEVRKILKEDWQVVCGILGFYTTLYLFSKLFTGGKKEEQPVVASAGAGEASSEVVSMADDKFSEWYAASPENAAKWEASLDDPKSYE